MCQGQICDLSFVRGNCLVWSFLSFVWTTYLNVSLPGLKMSPLLIEGKGEALHICFKDMKTEIFSVIIYIIICVKVELKGHLVGPADGANVPYLLFAVVLCRPGCYPWLSVWSNGELGADHLPRDGPPLRPWQVLSFRQTGYHQGHRPRARTSGSWPAAVLQEKKRKERKLLHFWLYYDLTIEFLKILAAAIQWYDNDSMCCS